MKPAGDYNGSSISIASRSFPNSMISSTGIGKGGLTSRNGGGDYRNVTPGYGCDSDSVATRRDTALTTVRDSWTGHGDQCQQQSKINDTSLSLRGSPRFDLQAHNGLNFSRGGHQLSPRVPTKHYATDFLPLPPRTNGRLGGLKYGQDRERMKEELANSNAMANRGGGILPGGIQHDRGLSQSHLLWRGTRSDMNSSIHQPQKYSLSGTNSTPSLNGNPYPTATPYRRRRWEDEINDDPQVSSTISRAQGARNSLRSGISQATDQARERIDPVTRLTASWNNVGDGASGRSMSDWEQERELNANKRAQQQYYRADLERQVEQKNKQKAEENRVRIEHPLGPDYNDPYTYWQTSTRTNQPNVPQQISNRNLVQPPAWATRPSQNKMPSQPTEKVSQAWTNLRNSRISPDTYYSRTNNADMASNGSHHTPSQTSTNGAYNFRANSSPSSGRNDIPPQPTISRHPNPERLHEPSRAQLRPHDPYRQFRHPPSDQFQNRIPYHPVPTLPAGPYPYPHAMHVPQHPYPFPGYAPNPYATPPPPQPYAHSYPQPAQVPQPQPYYPYEEGINQNGTYPSSESFQPVHSNDSRQVPLRVQSRFGSDQDQSQRGWQGDNEPYEVDSQNAKQLRGHGRQMDKNLKVIWKVPPTRPSKSTLNDLDKLRDYIEDQLDSGNVDFDELRESVFGKPNNWRTSNTLLDTKPLKDMINRGELAQQIEINSRQRAIKAAKDKEEEEKLDRKIQQYHQEQKLRQMEIEASQFEANQPLRLAQKVVTQGYVKEQHQKSKFRAKKAVAVSTSNSNEIVEDVQRKKAFSPYEDPEQSLAKKIRSPSRNRLNCTTDHLQARNNNNNDDEGSYIGPSRVENQPIRSLSPPIPTHRPKPHNEDSLREALKSTSRSPSHIRFEGPPKQVSHSSRARNTAENALKSKISSSSL